MNKATAQLVDVFYSLIAYFVSIDDSVIQIIHSFSNIKSINIYSKVKVLNVAYKPLF